jgi:hypothetical protein
MLTRGEKLAALKALPWFYADQAKCTYYHRD